MWVYLPRCRQPRSWAWRACWRCRGGGGCWWRWAGCGPGGGAWCGPSHPPAPAWWPSCWYHDLMLYPGPHLMCRWAYMLAWPQVSSASLRITSEMWPCVICSLSPPPPDYPQPAVSTVTSADCVSGTSAAPGPCTLYSTVQHYTIHVCLHCTVYIVHCSVMYSGSFNSAAGLDVRCQESHFRSCSVPWLW